MVRVEPLGDDARRLLVLAAADDSGDVGTLLRASERLGFGPDALDVAERAGLLTAEGPRLRFRHPLAALGGLPRRGLRRAPRGARGARRRARRRRRRRPARVAPRRRRHRPRRRGGRGAGPHRRPCRQPRRAHGRRPRAGARRRARFRSRSAAPSTWWRPPSPRRWPGASAMPCRCSIVPSPNCATRWCAPPRRGCAAWCRWPSGDRRMPTGCWPTRRARCCRPTAPPGSGC